MKEINIQVNEFAGSCYSCQRFQDDFKYFIDQQYKFCSILCLLNDYSNEHLKMFWGIILPRTPMFATRSKTLNILARNMEVRGW